MTKRKITGRNSLKMKRSRISLKAYSARKVSCGLADRSLDITWTSTAELPLDDALLAPKCEPLGEPEPGAGSPDAAGSQSGLQPVTFLRTYSKIKPLQEIFSSNPINPVTFNEVRPVIEIVKPNCRLCLQEIISIATPIWGDSGIHEKVLQCCPVTVHETDMFQLVCFRCKHTLDIIYKFHQMCLKSNEIFLNLSALKEEDPFPVITKQPSEDVKEEIQEEHSDLGKEEDVTTTNCESEDELNTEFPCEVCPMICFQEEEFEIHRRSHKETKRNIMQSLHLCPICGRTFQKSGVFWRHTRTHIKRQPRVCGKCGKVFASFQSLRAHETSTHLPIVSVACHLCGSQFKGNSTLQRHIDSVHARKPKSSCPYCDRKFSCRYNMRVHLRTHTGEEPYACPNCSLSFAHRVTMKLHCLKEHKVDLFDPPTTKSRIKRKKRKNKRNVAPSQID